MTVTYVDPTTGTLKLQQIGAGTSALTELTTAFRAFPFNKANDTPLPVPRRPVTGSPPKFSEDGNWYRAKVRRNDREKRGPPRWSTSTSETPSLCRGPSSRPLTQPQFSGQTLRPRPSMP